ncbi:unnamed protein product [Hydatigera taeniaeformis]|uniref:SH3 domain-containing protein n=1 Tax=Hydatigena taeniaeformis TaxID=6205 RepID=A0A0R3X3E7_HYDTA|nr:unnamed protein product [Hydatigera taeniaeformis]
MNVFHVLWRQLRAVLILRCRCACAHAEVDRGQNVLSGFFSCVSISRLVVVLPQSRLVAGTENLSSSTTRCLSSSACFTSFYGLVCISCPCCRALYQFEAENDTELEFSEGEVIQLIRQVDENWYEGRLNNKEGFFPVNYVEVIEPLPSSATDFYAN